MLPDGQVSRSVSDFGKQRHNPASCACSLICSISYPYQEKIKPRFPIAPGANPIKQVVIGTPVGLEVEAEVQDWIAEYSSFAEHERDEQPSQPPIAIQEWVDRLELDLRKSGPDQYGKI
jgi:hypothetical protein